jgi:hypothetical protein
VSSSNLDDGSTRSGSTVRTGATVCAQELAQDLHIDRLDPMSTEAGVGRTDLILPLRE